MNGLTRENLMAMALAAEDGEAYALLRTGCGYIVDVDGNVVIEYQGFDFHEDGNTLSRHEFKIPHAFLHESYTRSQLVALCNHAFVPQSKWRNRDSAHSQIKVGELLVALKANKNFKVRTRLNTDDSLCITDQRTIWIDCGDELYYLPTEKRLEESKGGDWY